MKSGRRKHRLKRCQHFLQGGGFNGADAFEFEWVLRSNFGFDKAQIILTLSSLLAAAELSFESETSIEVAVELFRQNKADFSDCVHIALSHAAGMTPMWTFDRAASKVDGAKLLSDSMKREI